MITCISLYMNNCTPPFAHLCVVMCMYVFTYICYRWGYSKSESYSACLEDKAQIFLAGLSCPKWLFQ